MNAVVRELKVPGVIVLVMVATLVYSWMRNAENAAAVSYWPAADPALMERVLATSDNSEDASVDAMTILQASAADVSAD